ncbi:GGDEF domain-containing protein [Vibrio aestuarianus]|uniref:GGDEF domain-containing protein n=1 Tax=Vibrio aestuarianus TaxID=28171 RepID=UPI001558DAB0|nr:diguanylate cyclase [Vibrio aestuarianus]MDE1224338.1 GGDEF domain-containing protein [Vibrio aestuarianus]MDE1312079.1 GGDEF domain-containing protein [Vibrio aestuarianus]NGZ14351.1 GGDEF domain-containing protein [Vibrio aestuarianus]NGZ93341.1 GGDEF domain-containing protein [Vibrio aestuarianus subsp. cardii]NKZ50499.1 GGDEF domain-containing protein [Vibrio aestuarianus]
MAELVGRHLEEMANMQLSRKRRVVGLCSVVSATLFSYYGFVQFIDHSYYLSLFNFICLLAIIFNAIYLYQRPDMPYADLVLSGILLTKGIMLLLYSAQATSGILWLYPILAAVIFINDFKIGIVFSFSFSMLVGVSLLVTNTQLSSDYLSADRFVISLTILGVICHISAYYYNKAINYIQSLYQEGIEDLAYTDQLTGLANRWSFENWANEKLSQQMKSNSITALVFLDIDNFKSINDNYGHDVGDKVLQYFANRLKNNVRNRDRKTAKHDCSIARFAGDEFVLLLYDVRTKKDLDAILNRICYMFEDKYQSSEMINNLTVSVGAALFPNDADNLPELTRCADKAMYWAKHKGKNQYQYYQHISSAEIQESKCSATVTPIKKASESYT